MKTLIVAVIQSYFWLISRLRPDFSAKKALKLMFTVDKAKTVSRKIPASDAVHNLPGGAHLHEWRGTSGKSVLLIHGWNGSLDHFQALIPKLVENNVTIYGVSPVGFGLSAEKVSHPRLFVEAIKETKQLLPGKVDVAIGHSMGAGALAIAASEVSVADKLILISGPASFLDVIKRFAAAIKLSPRATESFANEVEALVGKHEEVEVARKVSSLEIPCTIIHDKFDKQIPYKDALRLADSLKIATLHSTENLGHTRVLFNDVVCKRVLSEVTSP